MPQDRFCQTPWGLPLKRMVRSLALAALLGMAAVAAGCDQINPNLGVAPTQPSSITFITPSSKPATCPTFPLMVNGSGFAPGDTVQWNQGTQTTNLATTYISSSEVDATVPGSLIASQPASPPTVSVFTPGQTQGNGLSNFVSFTVNPPPCPGSPSNALSSASRDSLAPAVSADHRYVAFVSVSADPATNAGTGLNKIFVRDTCTGAPTGCMPQTTLVSAGASGADPNGESNSPSISADGRFVAFASDASNLVSDDTNGVADVFVRDTCTGAPASCVPSTQRISVGVNGAEANGASESPSISADGRFVAFSSTASNLVSDGSSALTGAFLRDICFGAGDGCTPSTTRIPISSLPTQ